LSNTKMKLLFLFPLLTYAMAGGILDIINNHHFEPLPLKYASKYLEWKMKMLEITIQLYSDDLLRQNCNLTRINELKEWKLKKPNMYEIRYN
jgi:hypothetical protein